MAAYCKIPIDIFNDKRLQSFDIALLSYLFFLAGEKRKIEINFTHLENKFNINNDNLKNIILRLKSLKWIDISKDFSANTYKMDKIIIHLNIPQIDKDPYNQAGSKIARVWSKYFSGRMIKHDDIYQLTEYVDKGMEEELVIEIMRYSSERVKDGRAFHYTRAILFDLYKRGILSVKDYKKDKESEKGDWENGQQFSGDNSSEEKRIKRKEFKKEEYR